MVPLQFGIISYLLFLGPGGDPCPRWMPVLWMMWATYLAGRQIASIVSREISRRELNRRRHGTDWSCHLSPARHPSKAANTSPHACMRRALQERATSCGLLIPGDVASLRLTVGNSREGKIFATAGPVLVCLSYGHPRRSVGASAALKGAGWQDCSLWQFHRIAGH